MTSTNDGKDVKNSQIGVQKAKTFYIELYKTLEARLSVESELGARTSLLCEAWRRVHCLCQHSAASTHPHLISWLQRHTAQTLLQSEWRQTSINQDKHDALGAAIDFFILECQEAAITRAGGARPQWEAQLLQRARWFHTVLADPWGNAVLRALLDRDADPPTDQQILEWLKEERGVFFVARLRQLASSRKTVDIALSLASAVMERARACAPPGADAEPPQDAPEDNDKPPTFTDILSMEAGFTVDVWELITDIEFVLLYNERSKCIALAKQTPLKLGYQQVERLHSRIDISPREKRLWKNATDVAILIAQIHASHFICHPCWQRADRAAKHFSLPSTSTSSSTSSSQLRCVNCSINILRMRRHILNDEYILNLIQQLAAPRVVMIARCMVVPVCAGAARAALYGCARSLARLLPAERLPAAAAALAAPAATARHLHTLALAIDAQCKNERKPFVCELYIRAITAGMNELERLKLTKEKESEARLAEKLLSSWFTSLGSLLGASARLAYECALTAFSLHPSPAMYERIREAPQLQPVPANKEVQEPESETNSEFGSWATDSRSQTNLVKTSETLNLKKIQKHSNVLSTAVLNEGEGLGLSPELCQDLIVLLSGPRVKTLSWDMDKEVLVENCRSYMERTHGGTRALTTELKYLNLGPDSFMHLPEEEEDENDIYYGIEKGYEHLVELQDPEEIWHTIPSDPERTESCCSTEVETFIPIPKQKKKLKEKLYSDSSDEEELDPLGEYLPVIIKPKQRTQSNERKKCTKDRDEYKVRKKKEGAERHRNSSKVKKDSEKAIISELIEGTSTPDVNKPQHKPKKERKKRIKKEKDKKDPPVKKSIETGLSRLVGKKVMLNPKNTQELLLNRDKTTDLSNQLCITDSDYDSQGKSSIASAHTEANDPEVLFDGLFSMDEQKSLEKTSEPLISSIDKPNASHSGENIQKNRSLIKLLQKPTKTNSLYPNKKIIESSKKLPKTQSAYPILNRNTYDISNASRSSNLPHENAKVKQSIKRLLEFRRQKSASDLLKGTKLISKPQQNINVINRIDNNLKILPVIPKAISVPDIPKLYINKQQSQQLSLLTNEVNNILQKGTVEECNYQSTPNIPTGQPNFPLNNLSMDSNLVEARKSVHEHLNKVELNNPRNTTGHVTGTPKLSKDSISNFKQSNTEINVSNNNLSMDSNLVEARKSVHEHLNKVELKNPRNTTGHVTGTPNLSKDSISNFKQSNTEINVSNTEQGELHDFFKELHRSINAGVRNDYSPVSVLKPHNEVPTSSLINYSKQIKHLRKVENAPNTFSRLQYMHKNKQGENLEKQMCQAPQNNLQVLSQHQTIEQQNVIESILARFNCIRKVEKKPQGKVNSANELPSSSLSISNAHQSVIRKAIGPDDRHVLKPNFMPSKHIIIQSTNISSPRITKVHEKDDNIGPDEGLVLKSNYIPSKHTLKQSTNVSTPTTTKVHEKDNNIGPDDRLVMKSNYMTMKHTIIQSTNISTPKTTKVHEKGDKLRILLRQQNSTSKPRIISDSVINKGTCSKNILENSVLPLALNRLSQNVDYKRIKDCQLKIRSNKNLPVQQSVAEIQPRSTSILKTASTKNDITTTQHKAVETINESMQNMRSEDQNGNETKCEQDWESVLNDLLSHKTPMRGPNALDMVLKKDQRNLFNDVRENRLGQKNSATLSVTEKLKKSHDEGIIKETLHVIPQQSKTFMSTENITALETQSSKNFLTHSKNNTCLKIKPHILKPKEQHSTKKSNQNVMRKQVSKIPEANISLGPQKKDCPVPQASIDSISSDLFFSDYDILEELMDDDLRQEIGELSSDEENLRDKNSFPNKQSGRRKCDIGKPVSLLGPPSFDSTDNLNLRQNDCPSNKQVNIISQNNIDVILPSVKPCCENTNLIINKPIHNTMFIPNNTKFQSRIQQGRKPNIIQQTSKLNTTLTSVQSNELDQFKKDNEIKSAHQTPAFTPNSSYTATTVHMPKTHTNVNCTNQNYLQPNVQVKEISQEMFTAEKQQPSIQNMLLSQERAIQNVLLIRPEIVYQPYTIQIPDRVNSTICNLNSDNFVTVDAVPTISMYGAPVINPVIISNTVTVPMTETDSKLNIYSSIKNSYNNSFDIETARSAKNLRVPESSVSRIIEENPLNTVENTADATSHFLNIHRSNADLSNQNNEKAGTANEFVSNNSFKWRMLAEEKEPLTVTTSSNTVRAAYKSILKKSVASSDNELNKITPYEFKNLPVDLKSHEINQKPRMGSDISKNYIVGNEFKSDNSSRIVLSKIHKNGIEISSSCATSAVKNKESENTNNVNESHLSENMIDPSKVSPLKVTRSTHSPKHTMTAVDDLKTDNKVKNCIANNTFERKVLSEGYDNCNAGTLCCTENAVTKMYKQSNTEPAECVPDVTQKVLNNTTNSETKEQSINLANVVNPKTSTEIKGYNSPTKINTERKVLCEVQEKLHLYSEKIISKTSPISEDGFKKENQTTRDERIKEKKLAILNRQVHIFNNSKPIPLTYDCLKSVIFVAQKIKPTEVKISVTQPVKVKNDFSQRETIASIDTVDKISNANDNKSLHTEVLKENNESDPTKCLRSSNKLVIGDTLVVAKSKNNEGKAVETQIKIKVPSVNKRKVSKRIKNKTKRKVQRNKSSSRKTKSDNNQNPLKKVDSFIEKLRPLSIDIEDQLQGALILKTISQKANDIGIEDQPRGSIIPETISQMSNDIVKTTGNQNVRKDKSIKGNITTEKDIHCHPTNQGNISKNKDSMGYKGLKIANYSQPTLKDVNHRDIRNENNLFKKGKTLHDKQNIITGEDVNHQPTNQQNKSEKGKKIHLNLQCTMGLNKINKPLIEAQTTNGDKLSTNTENPQNKTKINSIQNGQIMETSHTNIYMKSQKNNALDQNVIDSYRDQIKFTELPRQENDDPLKRCVSIKLANGNSFKATISGKAPIDLKYLFDVPELRKVLLNFLPSKSKCVLSIPQLGSSRGVKLETQVIGPKKNLETINLVSDDEEDPASHEFQTEFGKFYVRGLTDVLFSEHQKIFSKKCSVKLNRSQESSKTCSSTDDNIKIIDDVSSTTCTRIISSDDMDPQLGGVNNNQIIEIDDSSNDSTDVMNSGKRPLEVSEGLKNGLRELKETLLKELYVDLNTKPIVADELQLNSPKKIDVNIKELKETLLKDLCGLGGADQNTEKIKSDGQVLTKCDVMEKKSVEAHSTGCQSKNDNKLNNTVILPSTDLSVDSTIPNIQCIEGPNHASGRKPLFVTSQDELIPIKECQLKIKKCDDLVKNYQLLKQKLCYVYLERCDKFISSETTMAQKEIDMSETTTVSELEELKFNRKTQSTELDEFNSIVIRRSKSFSILNELDICDESPIDQLAMGPIEYSMSEDEKAAKSYYEKVGKMNDDFNSCQSDWCMTKFEFHYLAKLIQHDNYLSDDVSTDYESDHNDYESVVSESLSSELRTPNILPQVPSLLCPTVEVSTRSISYSDYNTQQTLATNTNSSHHLKRKHDASENMLSNEKIFKLDRIGCQVQDLNNIQKTVLQEVPTNSCPESRNITNNLDTYDDLANTNLNITSIKSDNCITTRNEEIVSCFDSYKKSDVELKQTDSPARKINEIKIKKICRQESISNVAVLDCINENREVSSIGNPVESLRFESDYDNGTIQSFGSNIECAIQGTENNTRCIEQDTLPYDQIVQQRNMRASDQFVVYDSLNQNIDSRNDNFDKISCSNIKDLGLIEGDQEENRTMVKPDTNEAISIDIQDNMLSCQSVGINKTNKMECDKNVVLSLANLCTTNVIKLFKGINCDKSKNYISEKTILDNRHECFEDSCNYTCNTNIIEYLTSNKFTAIPKTDISRNTTETYNMQGNSPVRTEIELGNTYELRDTVDVNCTLMAINDVENADSSEETQLNDNLNDLNQSSAWVKNIKCNMENSSFVNTIDKEEESNNVNNNCNIDQSIITSRVNSEMCNMEESVRVTTTDMEKESHNEIANVEQSSIRINVENNDKKDTSSKDIFNEYLNNDLEQSSSWVKNEMCDMEHSKYVNSSDIEKDSSGCCDLEQSRSVGSDKNEENEENSEKPIGNYILSQNIEVDNFEQSSSFVNSEICNMVQYGLVNIADKEVESSDINCDMEESGPSSNGNKCKNNGNTIISKDNFNKNLKPDNMEQSSNWVSNEMCDVVQSNYINTTNMEDPSNIIYNTVQSISGDRGDKTNIEFDESFTVTTATSKAVYLSNVNLYEESKLHYPEDTKLSQSNFTKRNFDMVKVSENISNVENTDNSMDLVLKTDSLKQSESPVYNMEPSTCGSSDHLKILDENRKIEIFTAINVNAQSCEKYEVKNDTKINELPFMNDTKPDNNYNDSSLVLDAQPETREPEQQESSKITTDIEENSSLNCTENTTQIKSLKDSTIIMDSNDDKYNTNINNDLTGEQMLLVKDSQENVIVEFPPCPKNITLLCENSIILKGSIIENPIVGTCYVFPIINSDTNNIDNEDIIPDLGTDLVDDFDLTVTKPKVTYSKINPYVGIHYKEKVSRRGLKRKIESVDNKLQQKKYRKGKNIDCPKITVAAMCDFGYSKQFKNLSIYCNSIKFSYTKHYHLMQVDEVDTMLKNWPIDNSTLPAVESNISNVGNVDQKTSTEARQSATDVSSDNYKLFVDNFETKSLPDPLRLTLAEELSASYDEEKYFSSEINETNFKMGFGERSGRVNQNLIKEMESSKFSAVTLSDVKQYQPFLQSVDTNKSCYRDTSTSQNQLRMLKKCYSYIKLRDKVKNFFNKTTAEFNYLSIIGKFQLDKMKSDSDNLLNNMADFPFGLVVPEFFEPPLMESIVQVVQVGQLPVSAGAQNPVTCDPRVTQVTDASPPQYSVESVSHDGLQPNIKTEYTELTTADISLPIMSNFEHQHQEPISASQGSSALICNDNVTIETEVKIEVLDEGSENTDDQSQCHDTKDFSTFSGDRITGSQYSYDDTGMKVAIKNEPDVKIVFEPAEDNIDHNEVAEAQHQQNGSSEKPDQLAHAMNAAGITTSPDTAIDLSNTLPRSVHYENENNYNRTNITAMTLQQALRQVLPLNKKTDAEINPPVSSQILHIVNGKSTSLTQIALDNNQQQSVINTPNTTPVLHIVQSKSGSTSSIANDSPVHNSNSYSGLSLVDAGLSQRGNQLLHIVNTGNQKSNNTTQLLKRVNLLTNLTNVQGSTEQKMVQFVCKSTDAKGIQLNTHQRSMVLRLHPIESPQSIKSDSHESNPTKTDSRPKEPVIRQELKSRSVYEENYAKFIQNSTKRPILDKSTSLPKFNQAFGKPVFQDNQKRNEIEADSSHLSTEGNIENNECQSNNHSLNLESARQVGTSPPLLFRKQSSQVSQAQQNLVQQIKQAITPMNLQTMHGGVIYTRQIPVNIGGGQTINLITVPSTERIDDSQKQKTDLKFGGKGEVEQSIIKIVPQSPARVNSENSVDDNNSSGVSTENAQNSQPPPMLTQMRIKLPMLSKNPQMVSTARVVRPSFLQIHRNVITGSNQPVFQQLVLATTPTLGQQAIRLPHAQTSREIKMGADSQSSPESQMSSSTLEQLREFDMVLEQVKERSTVQPNGTPAHDFPKAHTNSTETTDTTPTSSTPAATTQQVLYSIGNNQPLNIAYVHRKSTVVATAATTSFARSPDTSGIVESPTSSSLLPSTHAPQNVTSETTNESQPPQSQHKSSKVSSKSKSRPKSHHSPFKINPVPPKPSNQKPIEDEQTTQRILYILAEYKEQVENSPDKDKPAPRRRTNLQAAAAAAAIASASGSTKRKKSTSGSRRSGRDSSPLDDNCRTMGSEDSSCGTSQGDCSESCLELNSPQSSPRKVAKKLSFEQDSPVKQLRLPTLQPQVHSQQQQSQPRGQSLPLPQLPRNVLVTDGPTIAVTRAAPGKPATAVLMPANYILPVSMVKNGQQIAIVTNRGPKILTVQGAGEGVPTNALLLQRLIGPGGLKPLLARPGIRQVRLPTAALHNLQTFNLTAATSVQQPVASPAPATSPPDLIDTKAPRSPWTAPETEEAKPADSSPEQPEKELDPEPEPELEPEPDPDPEPWNVPQDYSYEETVRTEMDRTVLDAIPDRYSPDMEAQRIFDKMFDVESKKGYIIDSQDDSPRCPYDIDTSDCDDKAFHQVVQRRDGNRRFVSAATLRQKFALMEDELRLQKSLSEECEDLGVDSPSASDLFPEAELLFSSSPAHESHHQPHTPLPVIPSQPSGTSKPELEEQSVSPADERRGGGGGNSGGDSGGGLGYGLEDVGVVTVSEDGLRATIALDHEEFARSHPNTTFHTEPGDDGEVQPVTLADLKARHITPTIFQAGRAPVLVTAPHTVISQATPDGAGVDRHLATLPKDDTYRYDSILNANATQVIRRVGYDHRRDYLDDPDAKMGDDSGDATLESLDDRSTPERHSELFWDRTSRSRLDFSSDSDKCCKSPYDENNSTDSSVANMRLDSVIKDARVDRTGADVHDDVPPLRTYPPKRPARDRERSLTGKSKEERFPETLEGRRRASNRGVVKRGCHCCSGSPAPQKPKRPRQRKPTLDFN